MSTLKPALLSVASAATCIVAFSAGCSWPCQDSVTVDPVKVVIVAPKTAQDAADELKLHLKLITGVEVPVADKVAKGAYAFTIEPSEIGGNPEACEWEVTPRGAAFRGNAYFAVVDFLENALGVRWPEGDFVAYDAQNPLLLKREKGAWAPELKIHTVRAARGNAASVTFNRRMRAGSHDAPLYGHAFAKYWKMYGKDHPEYFAMRRDGLRGPKGAKADDLTGNVAVDLASKKDVLVAMCCTSTGLVSQIVSNWVAAGKPEYINICENDVTGRDSCQCPACKALDVMPVKVDPKRETHYSDRYVNFGNRVLEAARPYRADVKACYYAYNATQDAPRRERPDPATVVGLVPTIFTDKYIADYIGSWKKAGAEHFFYRPNRHHYYNCPYLPIGGEEHFYGIFKSLVAAGTIGFDYDANASVDGSYDWLDRYVLMHAMQDPSKPFSHWEDHYCAAFGAAAGDVKAYWRFWREEVWNKRLEPNLDDITTKGKWFNFGRGLVHNLKDYYRAEDFDAAEKFLKAAEAQELSPSRRELVRRLRVRHDHAKIFFEAVAHKSKANTEALVAYRKAHGYPLYTWSEQYFGDITGIEKLLGPDPSKIKNKKK